MQAIGIWMLITREHLADAKRLTVAGGIGDAAGDHLLDGGAGGGKPLGDLLVGEGGGDLLAQPFEGYLHANCSRNLRSPSYSSRMSLI